jgi:hypothetical protein
MTNPRYEVFQGPPSHPLWLESFGDLETASLRMKLCAAMRPGPYFIYCTDSGRILVAIDTSSKR